MACCAMPGGCDNPNCYCCVILPQRFPQTYAPCDKVVLVKTDAGKKQAKPCRLILGHLGPCRPPYPKHTRETKPDTRDGAPKLAAARKRQDLPFQKRQRAGPHWIPPDRRA